MNQLPGECYLYYNRPNKENIICTAICNNNLQDNALSILFFVKSLILLTS